MKNRAIVYTFFLAVFVLAIDLAAAQTVYVTPSGKKYHKKNCTVVTEGKKGIELAEAKKKGLEACNVCKPNLEATDPKKKK